MPSPDVRDICTRYSSRDSLEEREQKDLVLHKRYEEKMEPIKTMETMRSHLHREQAAGLNKHVLRRFMEEQESHTSICEIANPKNLPTCNPIKCAQTPGVVCKAETAHSRCKKAGFGIFRSQCLGCSCRLRLEEVERRRKERDRRRRPRKAKSNIEAKQESIIQELVTTNEPGEWQVNRQHTHTANRRSLEEAKKEASKTQQRVLLPRHKCEITNPRDHLNCDPVKCAQAEGVMCRLKDIPPAADNYLKYRCTQVGFKNHPHICDCSCTMVPDERKRRRNQLAQSYRLKNHTPENLMKLDVQLPTKKNDINRRSDEASRMSKKTYAGIRQPPTKFSQGHQTEAPNTEQPAPKTKCVISKILNSPTCNPVECAKADGVQCRSLFLKNPKRNEPSRCIQKGFSNHPRICGSCSCVMDHDDERRRKREAKQRWYRRNYKSKARKMNSNDATRQRPPNLEGSLIPPDGIKHSSEQFVSIFGSLQSSRKARENNRNQQRSTSPPTQDARKEALATSSKDSDATYACEISNHYKKPNCQPALCSQAPGVSCKINPVKNACWASGFNLHKTICEGCSCMMTRAERLRRNLERARGRMQRKKSLKSGAKDEVDRRVKSRPVSKYEVVKTTLDKLRADHAPEKRIVPPSTIDDPVARKAMTGLMMDQETGRANSRLGSTSSNSLSQQHGERSSKSDGSFEYLNQHIQMVNDETASVNSKLTMSHQAGKRVDPSPKANNLERKEVKSPVNVNVNDFWHRGRVLRPVPPTRRGWSRYRSASPSPEKELEFGFRSFWGKMWKGE